MDIANTNETTRFATFGCRKVAPRACVVAPKVHVRTFLCEALEELGFVACECEATEALGLILEVERPDLVLIAASADGIEPETVIRRLVDKRFAGEVLLIGNPDLLALSATHQHGADLGLSMLPVLSTPYRRDDLRERLSKLLPVSPPPPPPVDVAQALHAGWFEMWYQPKIDTRSLVLCGAEALIRMRHPTWGIVPPAYFIPDDGDPHFRALSEFVINRVMADWRYFADGYASIDLAVNLPIAFLQNPAAIGQLRRHLPKHPAFHGITIEINGTEIIRDLPVVKDIARQLRFDNVGIAIDDVGAEWPQLLYLEDFPFVEIKVDRKFVTGCATDRLKQSVCRRIVELGEGYGARTVAEGVETRAEFLAARDIGFDMAQGFLFAKPMGPKKFARTTLRGPLVLPQ